MSPTTCIALVTSKVSGQAPQPVQPFSGGFVGVELSSASASVGEEASSVPTLEPESSSELIEAPSSSFRLASRVAGMPAPPSDDTDGSFDSTEQASTVLTASK